MDWSCNTCGAAWHSGRYDESCKECGGGAMSRSCVVCGGRCGNDWSRAPMDSQDFGVAHWVGHCALPAKERGRLMREAGERGTPRG